MVGLLVVAAFTPLGGVDADDADPFAGAHVEGVAVNHVGHGEPHGGRRGDRHRRCGGQRRCCRRGRRRGGRGGCRGGRCCGRHRSRGRGRRSRGGRGRFNGGRCCRCFNGLVAGVRLGEDQSDDGERRKGGKSPCQDLLPERPCPEAPPQILVSHRVIGPRRVSRTRPKAPNHLALSARTAMFNGERVLGQPSSVRKDCYSMVEDPKPWTVPSLRKMR